MTADDVTRALPHALGPEKSALSTILQDPQEFVPVAIEEGLTDRHFYLPAHSILFGAVTTDFAAGLEIELVSLIQRLIDRGLLDRVGGPAALGDIYTYAPSPGHFRHHIRELRDKFISREIIRVSNEASAAVFDAPENVQETLEHLEREVMAIRDTDASERPQTVSKAAAVVIEKFQAELRHDPASKGISTGFEELDRMTNGLCAPELFVIAARPSVGKTSFMMNIVEHACIEASTPTLVFSAEMSTEAVIKRLIFSRARFALSQLSRGYVPNKGDLQRIQRATQEVASARLHIDQKSGPSINYIVAKARRMKREHGIELIAIDYLQLLKSTSKQAQFSREREIAEISAGLKGLAKDLSIPIILLAQLNRDIEKRAGSGDKKAKPRLSDLRESGAIEQDADIIGFLSRDDYQSDEAGGDGQACLDIAKNRNGPTGPVHLTFIADLMRFETGQARQQNTEPTKPASRWDK